MHHLETGRGPCKVVTGMNRDTRPDYILEIKEFGKADVKNDEMNGVDENYNKPEPEDATYDKVDDFNEDTCDVCANDYFTLFQSDMLEVCLCDCGGGESSTDLMDIERAFNILDTVDVTLAKMIIIRMYKV